MRNKISIDPMAAYIGKAQNREISNDKKKSTVNINAKGSATRAAPFAGRVVVAAFGSLDSLRFAAFD
jgi:hypothetical protein